MRIAIDARKLSNFESGIGSYTLNLAKGLLEEDANLELLLVRNRPRQKLLESSRVEEVSFPFHPDSPLTWVGLGRFLRGLRFDVFHSPFDIAPGGFTQPLVVTIHDLNWIVNPMYNSYNPLVRFFGGAFYRSSLTSVMNRASRLMAMSHATRKAILEYAPWHESKIRVAYAMLDTARVYPMERDAAFRALAHLFPPGTPFVLTVGQGAPYKNHFNAVKGFLEAFRDRLEVRMVLVRRATAGDRPLEKLLETPQARAQVLTVKYVTSEVLNALYNAARIVLHPSYYEGFGLPLVEAMATGVPVVTSTVSCMPEIAGGAALLASPGDNHAIAAALVRLDQDEPLRTRLIAAGRERLALFTRRECARTTLAAYREIA
jgi:glycosyltransferase involved in cell wall biosynthesis